MIKLLAFDLDGTTIIEHRKLSPENRRALLEAAERGVELVPCTGRMFSFLPPEICNLPGVRYAITSNGAAVYDFSSGEAVYQSLIPNDKALRVQEILNEYDVYIEYYRDGSAITRRDFPEQAQSFFAIPEVKMFFVRGKEYSFIEDFTTHLKETGLCPEKINLPFLQPSLRQEIWRRLEELGGLRLTSSLPDNLEINDVNAHKGATLLALAEKLNLSRDELMAIGDNGNDVTMLEAAGCSVAVADGAPEALAAAKHITAAHDKDGVAKAIDTYILQR